jgi:hypothetical protein
VDHATVVARLVGSQLRLGLEHDEAGRLLPGDRHRRGQPDNPATDDGNVKWLLIHRPSSSDA